MIYIVHFAILMKEGEEMYRRKNTLFLFLLFCCIIVFFIVPLVVSIYYGNPPFINKTKYLFLRNIIISNDPDLSDSWISAMNYDIYTWREVETLIINKQMTFLRIFRNIVILVATALVAITLDRMFGSRYFRRK